MSPNWLCPLESPIYLEYPPHAYNALLLMVNNSFLQIAPLGWHCLWFSALPTWGYLIVRCSALWLLGFQYIDRYAA